MAIAIELRNISKTFTSRNWKTFLFKKPQQITALNNISLVVNKGEIMGLLGPNGAGKTTLIKILSTLVTPDSGEGVIAGMNFPTHSLGIRKRIGMVSTNDRTFYWRLTGRENLDFFAALYNLNRQVKRQNIEKVLSLTNMEAIADTRFMGYSSGQKQRLAIARALLADPEILLMDEATTSLDPIATKKLLSFTKETLAKQELKTIVWCTHSLTEVELICDMVTILNEGSIVYSGPLKDIPYAATDTIEIAFDRLIHDSTLVSTQGR